MHKTAFALSLALFVPVAGRAAITVTSDQSGGTPPVVHIGKNFCNANTPINVHYDLGSVPNGSSDVITVFVAKNSSDCSAANIPSGTNGKTLTPVPQDQQAGTFVVKPGDLELDLANGCQNTDKTSSAPWVVYICVQRKVTPLLTAPTYDSGSLQVDFALVPPTPPTAPSLEPGDSHLRASWSPGNSSESIASYTVHVVASGAPVDLSKVPAEHKVLAVTSDDVTVDDDGNALKNDVTYDVSVLATDSYDNSSAVGPTASLAPQAVDDFYAHYRKDGGAAPGGRGCASTGGALWAALGALVLLRRRKRAAAAALACAVALVAPEASAAKRYERPARKLLVGVKLDRYSPQIDSEAGLAGTPYHDIFHGRAPPRFQLEVDWEVAHPFGSLLLGVTAGYWQNFGHGIVANSGAQASDTSTLDVLPFGAVATYRFDFLADRVRWFPLIPYAQAGLSRALWASFNGTGKVQSRGGGRGSGWTYGYTTALGVAFSLDAIDPELAREAFIDAKIQRTSLFAEYGWTRLDDFHKQGALILTDRAWRFGLSLEF